MKPDGGTLRTGIDLRMDVAVNTTIRFYVCNAPRHARRSCPGTAAMICGKTSIDLTSTPSTSARPTARLPEVLRTDRDTVRIEFAKDDLNALLERIAAHEHAARTPAA